MSDVLNKTDLLEAFFKDVAEQKPAIKETANAVSSEWSVKHLSNGDFEIVYADKAPTCQV